MKFIEREERRGSRYDIILIDPPEIRPRPEWRGLAAFRASAGDARHLPRDPVADRPIGLVLTAYSIRASFYRHP